MRPSVAQMLLLATPVQLNSHAHSSRPSPFKSRQKPPNWQLFGVQWGNNAATANTPRPAQVHEGVILSEVHEVRNALLSTTGTVGKRKREVRSDMHDSKGKRLVEAKVIVLLIRRQLTILIGLRHDGRFRAEVYRLYIERHSLVA